MIKTLLSRCARLFRASGRAFAGVAVFSALGCTATAPFAFSDPLLAAASRAQAALGGLADEAQAPRVAVAEKAPRGRDVDGDGAPDFENPTGRPPRQVDDYGSGAFGASRDGGTRRHRGVDYLAEAGQTVAAPISGMVTKIGYCYSGDEELRYVELTNPALGYKARVFYVEPTVAVGEALHLGQPIGRAMTLQARYGGISDHVHLELSRIGGDTIDAAELVPSPRVDPLRDRVRMLAGRLAPRARGAGTG